MRINLTTPMSDDKERQRRNEAVLDAIEQYTEERMNDEYGRIHTDGSRSGGQPLIANRKAHTMIIEVLAAWGIEPSNTTPEQLTIATTEALCRAIKQIEDLRQPIQSSVAAATADRIGGGGGLPCGVVGVATQSDAVREALVDLLHAVCSEKGFAQAVRRDSGRIYPWPALDLAEAKAIKALEQSK